MAGKAKVQPSIKMIWGIAKSPELRLTDEELHILVETHTGKDSLKKLNKMELRIIVRVLAQLKESVKNADKDKVYQVGNAATEHQRAKVYKLTQELGWDNPERVNGLCRRMFKIDRVEWLDYNQCSNLIEALKSIISRQKEDNSVLC